MKFDFELLNVIGIHAQISFNHRFSIRKCDILGKIDLQNLITLDSITGTMWSKDNLIKLFHNLTTQQNIRDMSPSTIAKHSIKIPVFGKYKVWRT